MFEAVYVDHGADWPETREYVAMFQGMGYPITVSRPSVTVGRWSRVLVVTQRHGGLGPQPSTMDASQLVGPHSES